jgi:hypothetical protein
MTFRNINLCIALAVLVFSCGSEDPGVQLSIRIHSGESSPSSLREYNPLDPPEQIFVRIYRSLDLAGVPVKDISSAWSDLPIDSKEGKKFLLVNVPTNENKNDPYVLRLWGSILENNEPKVDFCGVVGNILAVGGEKKSYHVPVDIYLHAGDCNAPCSKDLDCENSGYCLSFECQEKKSCTFPSTLGCPDGTYCNENNECSAFCYPQFGCTYPAIYCCSGSSCSRCCPGKGCS